MTEYRGNTFLEIEKAIKDGRDRLTLYGPQMRQVVELFAAVVEAKNEVVRENWALVARLASVCPLECHP